jgi:hypothetical protein
MWLPLWEVNELKLSQLVVVGSEDETVLLYPHQLKVVANGLMNVVVKQSYFKGIIWLKVLIESYFLSTWFAFR